MAITRIYEWAHHHPDRTAIVWNGRAVSYARFARGIEAARQILGALNLPIGSTAVLLVRSLLESWTVSLALRSLGLNTVAVTSTESAQALGISHVSCLIACQDMLQQGAVKSMPWSGARLIQIPADSYRTPAREGAPALPEGMPRPGGHILYTSGTTGIYKKLFLDGEQMTLRNEALATDDVLDYSAAWQTSFLGMWTFAGFLLPSVVWHAGGCTVFDQRTTWADHFFDHDVAYGVALPHMIDELLKSPRATAPLPVRRRCRLITGGGFLPLRMAQEVLERLADSLTIAYGATELFKRSMESDYRGSDDLQWLSPIKGRVIEIVDDEDRLCPAGTEGHLRVRLTGLDCDAYLDDPQASQQAFRNGCFYPGDMAVRRADGRIRVLGRSVDVLNILGQKFAAAPIEQALQERIGARAVCLFSGIGASGQGEVTAAVETDRPFDEPALREELRRVTRCDEVHITVLARFPRTRTGMAKIDRRALRNLVYPSPALTPAP